MIVALEIPRPQFDSVGILNIVSPKLMDPELTKLDMLTSFENLFSVSSNLHRHKRLLCQNEKGINTKNRSSFWSDVEHFLHVCLYLIPLPFITDFLARA